MANIAKMKRAYTTVEYKKILKGLRIKYADIIEEANHNHNKWYELFVVEDNGKKTQSVERADTFDSVVTQYAFYAKQYGLDNINISILEKNNSQKKIFELWDIEFVYNVLKKHFVETGQINQMKMIGSISCPMNGSESVYNRGCTDEGLIFADEIAFLYFNNRTCYVPELDDNDSDSCYTRNDFLELCDGNVQKAKRLFQELLWEHLETLLEQWELF